LKAESDSRRKARKEAIALNKKTAATRAKTFAAEYAQAAKSIVDLKRQARKEGGIFVEPESKVLLVVRIRG
jgi:large subunit ribosomal protein L7e